jgi:hypothetical protein
MIVSQQVTGIVTVNRYQLMVNRYPLIIIITGTLYTFMNND